MTKEIVKTEVIAPIEELKEQEFYQQMIEDGRAIIVEREFISSLEKIRGKWELGKRVIDEEGNLKRYGYGQKVVVTIAKDLKMSGAELFFAIAFAKKYPIKGDVEERFSTLIDNFKEGKSITWSKIKQVYLPKDAKEREKRHYITCFLDKEEGIIYIKEEFRDFKIVYR